MVNRVLRVGLVQHACGDDRQSNLAASISGIENAAQQGAQLVLLQELHRSRYFCQQEEARHFELAEAIPGETTGRLGELAAALGIVAERGDLPWNSKISFGINYRANTETLTSPSMGTGILDML